MIRDIFHKYVLKNLTAKLMALALAIALWAYAFSFSYSDQEKFAVRVNVKTPKGWSVVVDPVTVDVTQTYPRRLGKERIDAAVANREITVECEAPVIDTGSDEQRFAIPLADSSLHAPRGLGLKVIGFEPREVRIKFIREMSESVDVLVQTSDPPPGYEKFTYAIPSKVLVTGRKDVVADLARKGITTDTVYISTPPRAGAAEWQVPSQVVRLPREILFDGALCPIRTNESVQVRIDLIRKFAEPKSFPGIPIRILLPREPSPYPFDAALAERVRSADVTVTGPDSVVATLKPENILLYVDVGSDLKPSNIPYNETVRAQIVGLADARDLTLKLSATDCAVKISERAGK